MKSNSNAYVGASAISVVFSFLLIFVFVYSSAGKISEVLFQQSQIFYQHVNNNFKNSKVVLDGVTALFQTMGEVDNDQLSQYAKEMLAEYPHLHSIEYFSKVDHADRILFESSMRESGYANFSIKKLIEDPENHLLTSTQQNIYFPCVFIEPLSVDTARLIGLDGLSDKRSSDAFMRAIATGNSSISQPITMVDGGQGLMMFKAVYTKSVLPTDFSVRKENTFKVVAVIMRVKELLRSGLEKEFTHVELNRFDTDSVRHMQNSGSWLWEGNILPTYYKHYLLEFDDKTFSLELSRQLAWSDIDKTNIALAILFSIFITALIFWLTHVRLIYQRDKREAEEALYQEKEKAEITLYSIGDAVITTDIQGMVEFTNLVAEELIGLPLSETRGYALNSLLRTDNEALNAESSQVFWNMHMPDGLVLHKDPLTLTNQNGSKYVVEISISPIHDLAGENIGFVLVLRDVSHVRKLSRQLEYQATHDSLTDLINRSEFERRLEEALGRCNANNNVHALCYMDLDQFKIVNDSCGHLAGDHLLKQLSSVMKSCMRDTDLLARLGGDEFGVLLFDCPVDVANTIALKIKDMVSEFRFVWEEHAFDIGISIGLVPISNQSISAVELMKNADTACYVAKDKGRNRIHIYEENDSELAQRLGEMLWVQRIRDALANEKFFLAIQDVVSLGSDRARHREVLIRLHGDDGEPVPPMAFIPSAERYELMPQIDKWVFSRTLEMINSIEQCECHYNINISGQSLKDADFANYARVLLEQSNVDPRRICFEITETAAISNLTNATQFIHTMKELGVRFALDDFGRGMSSFGYLKTLPVDYLKIDGSFVRDMATDATDYAMVESITRIGHVMGLQVIAEFVEDDTTVALLRELGVDYGQGYGIHKPEIWLVEDGCPTEEIIAG